jgi:hypothetical protein
MNFNTIVSAIAEHDGSHSLRAHRRTKAAHKAALSALY